MKITGFFFYCDKQVKQFSEQQKGNTDLFHYTTVSVLGGQARFCCQIMQFRLIKLLNVTLKVDNSLCIVTIVLHELDRFHVTFS